MTTLRLGSRKGAFTLTDDGGRSTWTLSEPTFLGHVVQHVMADPRDPDRVVMACRTGHLGPTVFRSTDAGATWVESTRPPAFHAGDAHGRAVRTVFWLTPGHVDHPGTWYAGASPQGLFQSDHLYIGLSGGGVFESTDGGADWRPLNRGCAADFFPDPEVEFGHDPHCVRLHPLTPDRLYQQNHCGIYRLDRPGERWERIGDAMPRDVGDIGFPIELHPRDPDVAWVFPMDGTDVWPRTSPGGRPAAYMTRDAGATWERQDHGFPERGWFTVKRQAMTTDAGDPVGVYLGTTSGEVWASTDEGATWRQIAAHLPEIYSVEVG